MAVAIIPARLKSKRLSEKPLRKLGDIPLIVKVWKSVKEAGFLEDVLVATDSDRIVDTVESYGGKAVMTSKKHRSGTDRIAEAAKGLDSRIILNVQGDEPFIRKEMLKEVIKPLKKDNRLKMSTLMKATDNPEEITDPNVVKVVTDKEENALYFSREAIPYSENGGKYFKHIGIYGYRRDFLQKITELKPTPLEEREALEQLRVLENGYRIRVVETSYDSFGIDTPEQLETARRIIKTEDNYE